MSMAAAARVEEPPATNPARATCAAPLLCALIRPAVQSIAAAQAVCATDEGAAVAYLLLARAAITEALNAVRPKVLD